MTSPSTEDEALSGAAFRVEGVVQGVGFRWWTKDRADELHIRGTVRNLPDRSVEVVAYGSPSALGRLRSLLQQGPANAAVHQVLESPPSHGPPPTTEFRIVP